MLNPLKWNQSQDHIICSITSSHLYHDTADSDTTGNEITGLGMGFSLSSHPPCSLLLGGLHVLTARRFVKHSSLQGSSAPWWRFNGPEKLNLNFSFLGIGSTFSHGHYMYIHLLKQSFLSNLYTWKKGRVSVHVLMSRTCVCVYLRVFCSFRKSLKRNREI